MTENGWLRCPDNCAFDSKGRIWIATDGAPTAAGIADGLYAADTAGYGRALTRCFYQAPTGAEVCGPIFTPDDRTLFLAIQHPGEDARLDLREAVDALARLQGRHAAAAVGDRHHEEGWRRDRVMIVSAHLLARHTGQGSGGRRQPEDAVHIVRSERCASLVSAQLAPSGTPSREDVRRIRKTGERSAVDHRHRVGLEQPARRTRRLTKTKVLTGGALVLT